jgi:hypothetical protein
MEKNSEVRIFDKKGSLHEGERAEGSGVILKYQSYEKVYKGRQDMQWMRHRAWDDSGAQ